MNLLDVEIIKTLHALNDYAVTLEQRVTTLEYRVELLERTKS